MSDDAPTMVTPMPSNVRRMGDKRSLARELDDIREAHKRLEVALERIRAMLAEIKEVL